MGSNMHFSSFKSMFSYYIHLHISFKFWEVKQGILSSRTVATGRSLQENSKQIWKA